MQTLTVPDVVAACRKAYADGTLLAQHAQEVRGDRARPRYAYQVGDWHCAIGCALSADTLDLVSRGRRQTKRITGLIALGVVGVPDLQITDVLDRVQVAHDVWLGNAAMNTAHHARAAAEDEKSFLALLDELDTQFPD